MIIYVKKYIYAKSNTYNKKWIKLQKIINSIKMKMKTSHNKYIHKKYNKYSNKYGKNRQS